MVIAREVLLMILGVLLGIVAYFAWNDQIEFIGFPIAAGAFWIYLHHLDTA